MGRVRSSGSSSKRSRTESPAACSMAPYAMARRSGSTRRRVSWSWSRYERRPGKKPMHMDERGTEEHTQRSEKETDVQGERDDLQGSSREGIFATLALKSATGQAQLAPWRTEPEIGPERQEQLTRCLATTPDITRGIYPFKGMKLSRADVEWLLAIHANGDDPRVGSDEQQHRQGLDLRGADL